MISLSEQGGLRVKVVPDATEGAEQEVVLGAREAACFWLIYQTTSAVHSNRKSNFAHVICPHP